MTPQRRPAIGATPIQSARAPSRIRAAAPPPIGGVRQGIRPPAAPGTPTAIPPLAAAQGAGSLSVANRATGGGEILLTPAARRATPAAPAVLTPAVRTPTLVHRAPRPAAPPVQDSRPAPAPVAAALAPDLDPATLRRALAQLPGGDIGRLAEKLFPHFQRQVRRLQERRGGL
ncbi:hypothetical protein D3877_24040 [Azospirillum cavernae]|uniref:Uncharacterized protein n=1 Tax=Azospirillum cavernae TaxID=2320860 RepID=A0A418VPL3_9PROT|nr:hypothetical protein D3877_24040 [Azospirillum cavernae]